ncbi:uncharacterized protein KY384_007593 [Bacidia gigantensis]|uniref:uncharacterized protein n=1 Tax=Bacidia gigantensis TaxID=2732470 RepID=UPI001D03CDFD|nr:uncharacterized protein KY384_007593 [Bacidia gigantensis]KAG8527441.1 hypothetical protein KY384_007593 [Bacidia gigantensis]
MGRVLPWLTGNDTASAKTSAPPSKRQRQLELDSDSERTGRRRKVQPTRTKEDRAPSTSPPPPTLPSQSPLRAGLDSDDIYIMVEDEFLATAQLFTRHLHHAEYQRLQTLAKDRDVSTITNMCRPTDSKTIMRSELKMKKDAVARYTKTRTGVEDVLGGSGICEQEASNSDFEIHSDNEPWQGTHLQSFMTVSPRADLKSLTGLNGARSHTRAAAGFAKSERKTPTKSRHSDFETEIKANDRPIHTEDDDTDDLDAPVAVSGKTISSSWMKDKQQPDFSKAVPQPARRSQQTGTSHQRQLEKPFRRSPLDVSLEMSTETHSRISKSRRPISRPARSPAKAEESASNAAIRAKLRAMREQDLKDHDKATSAKANEIPIFLVDGFFWVGTNLVARLVYGGVNVPLQVVSLVDTCDILVGTPGRLAHVLQYEHKIDMTYLSHFIIDEADAMMLPEWKEEMNKFFAPEITQPLRDGFRKLCKSATDKFVEIDYNEEVIEEIKSIRDMCVKQRLLRRTDDDQAAFQNMLSQLPSKKTKILILTQSRHTATKVHQLLQVFLRSINVSEKLATIAYGKMDQADREIATFQYRLDQSSIMVGTIGLLARGLNFNATGVVVMWDVPKTLSEYKAAAGRLGRLGNVGLCIVFYTEKSQLCKDQKFIDFLKQSKTDIPSEL